MESSRSDPAVIVNAVWLPTSPPRPAPPLLTADEAILLLRIEGKRPRMTLRRYEDMGLIHTTQVGKHSRYRLDELLRFMERKQNT